MDNILGDIKGVKTYIGDIIVLGIGSFYHHIYQLGVILARLSTTGLKVNATKRSFGLKYIPYLGYIITGKGIKPSPQKLQGTMDIEIPTKK